jgi:hypothetical protein
MAAAKAAGEAAMAKMAANAKFLAQSAPQPPQPPQAPQQPEPVKPAKPAKAPADAYPDERPSMGLGLGVTTASTDLNKVDSGWGLPNFSMGGGLGSGSMSAGPSLQMQTSFGNFTKFQTGGVLDPNKANVERAKEKAAQEKKKKRQKIADAPKKIVNVEEFKNKRVSKLKPADVSGRQAGTMGGLLAKLKKQKQKEQVEVYKKQLEKKAGGADKPSDRYLLVEREGRARASLEEQIQDVLAHGELTHLPTLSIACFNGLTAVAKHLLQQPDASKQPQKSVNVREDHEEKLTALHVACCGGSVDCVQLLLDQQAVR